MYEGNSFTVIAFFILQIVQTDENYRMELQYGFS